MNTRKTTRLPYQQKPSSHSKHSSNECQEDDRVTSRKLSYRPFVVKNSARKNRKTHISMSSSAMKKRQLFRQDSNRWSKLIMECVQKRKPVEKLSVVQPRENPKLATILVENGVNYDQPLTPMQIVSNRALRLKQKETTSPLNNASTSANLPHQLTTMLTAGNPTIARNVTRLCIFGGTTQVHNLPSTTGAAIRAPVRISVFGQATFQLDEQRISSAMPSPAPMVTSGGDCNSEFSHDPTTDEPLRQTEFCEKVCEADQTGGGAAAAGHRSLRSADPSAHSSSNRPAKRHPYLRA